MSWLAVRAFGAIELACADGEPRTGFWPQRCVKLLIQVAVGANRSPVCVGKDLIGGKTWGLNLDDKKAVVAEVSPGGNAQTIAVAEYRGICGGR